MPKNQPTKNQHYVPQVYLKGFSPDSSKIYEYNLRKKAAIENPVSIESVCREKYLYEVRDNNGEILNTNYLEEILRNYEGQFADHQRKLLQKAKIKENYRTQCFLSKKEKDFWYSYAALHMMRNPGTLRGIKSLFQEELQGQITEYEAGNLAIAYCLPFFKKPENGDMNLFDFFLSLLQTKVLTVGFAESDNLFTSEHAMYGSGNSEISAHHFQKLWFPVSSNCGLLFLDPGIFSNAKKNCLIPLTKEEIRDLNKGIAYIAKQMVLSKHPFSEDDIRLIEEARYEYSMDEAKKNANSPDVR